MMKMRSLFRVNYRLGGGAVKDNGWDLDGARRGKKKTLRERNGVENSIDNFSTLLLFSNRVTHTRKNVHRLYGGKSFLEAFMR